LENSLYWNKIVNKGDLGPQGPQGPQGVLGSAGNDGEQGIQGNTGDTGPTGPTGPGANQSLDTTSDVSFNTLTITRDANINGRLYANYPDESIPISAIVGLDGMDGSQGPQGRQGPQGPQGPQGVGTIGPAGRTGPTGPTGPGANQSLNTTSDVSFNSMNITNDVNITGRLYANSIVGSTSIKYSVVQYDGAENNQLLNPVSQYVFIYGNTNLTLPVPNPSSTWVGVEVKARVVDSTIVSYGSVNLFCDSNRLIASGQGSNTGVSNLTVSGLSTTFICDGTYWIQFP
jgi:hypothetical protein